jgi:hypothetical protein
MSDGDFRNFEEFWPFYVREHSHKATRLFHFAGTSAAACAALAAIALRRPALVPFALLLGYGPAWFSHFVIEKNRPATFKYPLWSFQADWVMWGKMIAGTMDEEVERVMAGHAAAEAGVAAKPHAESVNGVNGVSTVH